MFALCALLLLSACHAKPGIQAGEAVPQEKRGQPVRSFPYPDVPAMLTTPEERASYLALHYWDLFDFSDTSLIALPEVTEQGFVDFLSILPHTDRADVAIDTLYSRAAAERAMLLHFMELGDKYLYEPNSPMYDERLYVLVLRALLALPALEESEKARPRYRLEMALKNCPGNVAADFAVTLRGGGVKRLQQLDSPCLLVYFNDPACEECLRVKELLTTSPLLCGLVERDRLHILSVCVEGKTAAWEEAEFPSSWMDGYDKGMRITREHLYDLKAMPTLYLLDGEKRVLLKDASVEQVEAWFRQEAASR